MKRRKFLKSVAHAGAAGLILPGITNFEAVTPANRRNLASDSAVGNSRESVPGTGQNQQLKSKKTSS